MFLEQVHPAHPGRFPELGQDVGDRSGRGLAQELLSGERHRRQHRVPSRQGLGSLHPGGQVEDGDEHPVPGLLMPRENPPRHADVEGSTIGRSVHSFPLKVVPLGPEGLEFLRPEGHHLGGMSSGSRS